jgi:hypothetical protein
MTSKKTIFLVSILSSFCSFCSFSQTKKEQLIVLSNTIDSLNFVIKGNLSSLDSLILLGKRNVMFTDSCLKEIESLKNKVKKNELDFEKKMEEIGLQNQIIQNQAKKNLDSISKLKSTIFPLNIFESMDFADDPFLNGHLEFDFNQNYETNPNDSLGHLNGEFIGYYNESYQAAYGKGEKLIYSRGMYKNGQKDGFWKYFLCDGSKKFGGPYLNGHKHGRWVNYDHCNNSFKYKYNEIIELLDLCQIDLVLNKEVVHFNQGIASDTVYYLDSNDKLVLKFSIKDSAIFYDNDQPFMNQKFSNIDSIFFDKNEINLVLFNKNGGVLFRCVEKNNKANTELFNEKGILIKKGTFVDRAGKTIEYDSKGKVISVYDDGLFDSKYGEECPCQ